MPVIFADGFETMFSPWTTAFTLGSCQAVEASQMPAGIAPHGGNYCGHFTTQATLQYAEAKVIRRIAQAGDVYVRAWFYIRQGITAMQNHDRFYMVTFKDSGGNLILSAGIRREGANPQRWVVWCRGLNTHRYGTSSIDATPRWLCLEAHYNQNSGIYELFVNGTLEFTVTAPMTNPPQVDTVVIGIEKTGTTGTAWDPTGQYVIDMYADDVVIAQEYIGPGVPLLPMLTVNSSPEIGVSVYVDEQLVGDTPITVELQPGPHTVRVEEEVTR